MCNNNKLQNIYHSKSINISNNFFLNFDFDINSFIYVIFSMFVNDIFSFKNKKKIKFQFFFIYYNFLNLFWPFCNDEASNIFKMIAIVFFFLLHSSYFILFKIQ